METSIFRRYHKGPNWKKIFTKKEWTKYLFWSLVMFLAGLTIRDVVQLCMQFAEDPKQTEFKMVFNDSMAMPNITFCMSKEQAFSHFKLGDDSGDLDEWNAIVEENLMNMTDRESFLTRDWDFRIVAEAYEVIATLSSLERETSAHGSARTINNYRMHPRLQEKREMVQKYLDAIAERNVTFTELTQKTGEEVLKRSMQRFMRQTFDEDEVLRARVKVSWISQMQMCFKPEFDDANYKPIEDQGTFFTMLLAHNVENLANVSVGCMTVDFHGRPSSIARFMQGKSQVIDGFNEDLCLGSRHEVYVEVRAYYEMLENNEVGTACHALENNEDDEFDCRSRCRLEMIREMCSCTAYSLSYLADDKSLNEYPLCDYTRCTIDEHKKSYSDKECTKGCLRNCKQIRYSIDHEVKGPMLRRDLTLITLNWRSFEYLSLEQSRVYTVTSFIANVGGSIGVWLGLSVLSLFQGLTFLITVLHQEVQQKISSVDQKDEPRDTLKLRRASESGLRKVTQVLPNDIAANPFANPFNKKHRNDQLQEMPRQRSHANGGNHIEEQGLNTKASISQIACAVDYPQIT